MDIANGIYYEFENLKTQEILPLHRVALNENYAMIVTTNSGLWRYKIGDTVQFTQLFPHKFRISGRTTQFVNAFGEELIQANADEALAIACKKTNALITDYTVAPNYIQDHQNGHHDWLIEFAKEPENMPRFAEILDNELQRINSDYEAKRHKNLALGCLQIEVLKQGSFQTWLQHSSRIGIQAKVPRLQNNRDIVNSILATKI
ncbi:MAG TPA: GH3 auxin-responsive promoter family protein, partial [Chitinophagales bacterium]